MSLLIHGERRALTVASGWVVILLAVLPALATPTGLNNIPTGDVVPQGILVLQGFANFDGDTSWFAGFKVGPAENLEVGLDGQLSGSHAIPAARCRLPGTYGRPIEASR